MRTFYFLYMDNLDKLKQLVYSINPLDDDEWNTFTQYLTFKDYNKGDYIIKQGETANTIYYIEKGITRNYFTHNGKEFTVDFHFDGELVSAFYSIITGMPSVVSVEIIESTSIIALPYKQLTSYYSSSLKISNVGRKIAEMQYTHRLKKEMDLLSLTAEERYNKLLKRNPRVVKSISVKHISSYLGIHPESLSRIRKMYVKS
ncbi:Crp/Fnr family transcriptional regulator [Flavobacterium arcticum]|uniref:Crp/Fnr family transcriptional regulator n=1 Tax=Flavobacterium arcticum TaxID=1784713 RepID=A0A345HCP4_9FLAO|nr:Crp/Fnr family transcriptional regulator [Flavobacterium arcticum]AXG74354.1 Crp/Fnr family transcriptional regulator [Flavobacterium arcticum]KAF2507531.1 Crp/Fnr family transcriptional regulator [Flavobacterium arcticum]